MKTGIETKRGGERERENNSAPFHPNHQRSRDLPRSRRRIDIIPLYHYTIGCFFRDPRTVIGAVRSLRATRRATRYRVYGNSMCWLCTTGENNTMASSLSVIIITTIVKLCNLFDSVRAPRKLVSLLFLFPVPSSFPFLSFSLFCFHSASLFPPSPSSLPSLLFFPSYSTNIASGSARGTGSTTKRMELGNERRRY